jgi:hypothetical protein
VSAALQFIHLLAELQHTQIWLNNSLQHRAPNFHPPHFQFHIH